MTTIGVVRRQRVNFLEPSVPIQACNGTALPLNVDTRVFGVTRYC